MFSDEYVYIELLHLKARTLPLDSAISHGNAQEYAVIPIMIADRGTEPDRLNLLSAIIRYTFARSSVIMDPSLYGKESR